MPSRPVSRSAAYLTAFVPLLAALIVWAPICRNYFQHDDFVHLYDIATLSVARFLTEVWAGHLYVLRNAVFLATFRAFGPDPRPFFWCVLLTHLANVLLLYGLIRRVTRVRGLACVGATLWGTAPVLQGTLGWYAVYGQVLLTMIVLLLLSSFVGLLEEERSLRAGMAVWWGVLLMAGGASFGIGLGVAAAFPVIVLSVVPPERRTWLSVLLLSLAPVLTFAIYLVLRSIPPPPPSVVPEALSAHGLVSAMPEVLVLETHLLAFGASTLVLGFLGLDRGYPDVITGVTAGAVLLVVGLGWQRSGAPMRHRLLAFALLLVAAYGSVALGRASSAEFFGVPMSRAATWIRYHYLPTAILMTLLSLALAALRMTSRLAAYTVSAMAGLWLAARLLVLVVRPLKIDHHDFARTETEAVLRSIRATVHAKAAGETVRIENRPFAPTAAVLVLAPGVFPGWAGVFAIFFPENAVDGRLVRFGVSDDDWRWAHERGGRMAELVVRDSTP